MYTGIIIGIVIVSFVCLFIVGIKAHQKTVAIATKRYEDAKAGKLTEKDLTEQERNLLNTFK